MNKKFLTALLVATAAFGAPCQDSDGWTPVDPLDHIEDGPSSACERPPKGCVPFDADLFRRCTPVMSIQGELLFWQVVEGDLDYALKMNQAASGSSSSFAQGNFESGSFNLDPGFRIGALYFRAAHNWEVRSEYTRLTAHGSDFVHRPNSSTEFLNPTWPISPSDVDLLKASSHTHMNYNVFDLLIDRHFTPNWHLRIRYGGGFTTAWIDQDWKVRYTDILNNQATVHNRWHFVGAGLKLVNLFDWYWGLDVYMTGKFALGALIGRYTNQAKQNQTGISVRDAFFHDTRAAFTTQFLFGPSWQKKLGSTRLEAFLGYEMNFWFNLQNIYHSTSGSSTAAKETWTNSSVMGLQGLTSRLTLDF